MVNCPGGWPSIIVKKCPEGLKSDLPTFRSELIRGRDFQSWLPEGGTVGGGVEEGDDDGGNEDCADNRTWGVGGIDRLER